MLELGVSSVVSGLTLKVIGIEALPLLLLYGLARSDFLDWKSSQHHSKKTVILGALFVLGLFLGYARAPQLHSWFRQDGNPEQIRGQAPIYGQPTRFANLRKLYLTHEVRPTYTGWSQTGIVNGHHATLLGSRAQPGLPAGSWTIAKCRLSQKHHRFCTPIDGGELVRAPTNLKHQIARARLKATTGFLPGHHNNFEATGPRYSAALATGARTLIPPVDIDRLARLGLLHLWAVSGLHVLLVGGFVLFIAQRIYLKVFRYRTRPAPSVVAGFSALPFVYLYAAFCGSGPSVVRATIAFTIFVLFRWGRRELRGRSILMLTLALELTIPSEEFLSAGSLLSHSAVMGILVVFSVQKPREASSPVRIWRIVFDLFKTGLAASLATAPFLILFFGSVAPAGILLGIVMVPVFSVVILPLCLLTTITIVIDAPQFLVSMLVWCSSQTMEGLHNVLLWLDQPGRRVTVSPDYALLSGCIVILIFWAWLRPVRLRLLSVTFSLFIVPFVLITPSHGTVRSMTVTALDVGHGDAFLITTAGGTTVLVDAGAGSLNGRGAKLSPQRLHRLGVSEIDLLVLTHRHPDHFGGTFRLLNEFPIRRCVLPHKESLTHSPQWKSLLRELKTHGVQCESVQAGDNFQILDLKVHFLAPLISVNNDDLKDSRDENDWSLAVILSTQNGHVWAFGDAPKDLEMDIMELNPTLPTGGLLLVPHHGSDTSSSEELLDGLKPDVAVVSHKRPLPNRVMERYRKRHIPMCGTSPGGTVHLRLRKGRIWIPMGCFVP